MTILSEYAQFAISNPEKADDLEDYLQIHPNLDYSIIYNRVEWEKFEEWRKENKNGKD